MLPTMLTLWGVVTTLQGESTEITALAAANITQVLLLLTMDSLCAGSSSVCLKVRFIADWA